MTHGQLASKATYVEDSGMAWIEPAYSHADVDLAGNVLIADPRDFNLDDFGNAIAVVNNWRSCHGFPLNTLAVTLRTYANKVSSARVSSLVAQRTKRLPAIVHKLRRLRHLKLSQFQDIGGCRAIVPNIAAVRKLRELYGNTRANHTLVKEDDYLQRPKRSGYRGIHLVYAYHSNRSEVFNGLKIEIQLRSQLQHAWATAVETAGLFSAQYLKSSQGDARWLRFFQLMGSAIALRERASLVPGTPDDPTKLIAELRAVEKELRARSKLVAYGAAVEQVSVSGSASHFLLTLNAEARQLEIKGFRPSELVEAQKRYTEVEQVSVNSPHIDAVLVSVESVSALRNAYPNYYLDTTNFVKALDAALASTSSTRRGK